MRVPVSPRLVLIVPLLVLIPALEFRCDAQPDTPPPPPWTWIESGGAVGEVVTMGMQSANTRNAPYVLACSPRINPNTRYVNLLPPVQVLAVGWNDAQGRVLHRVSIPAASGLVGLSIYFQGAVAMGQGIWDISVVCQWLIAPTGGRRFVRLPGVKSIPYTAGDGHAQENLADGTVLLCGGIAGPVNYRRDAHVFDPTRNASQRVGDMTTDRQGHVARRLPDGTVLVIGGDRTATAPTAELYDPKQKQFLSLGTVPHAFFEPLAVLTHDPVSGRDFVLVAGGYGTFWPNATAGALLYDVQKRSFLTLAGMTRPRAGAAAIALHAGAVLITGGRDGSAKPLDTAEVFLPATRQFYAWGKLRHARYDHAALAVDPFRVVLIGGVDAAGSRRDLELFDGIARTSTSLPVRMHVGRSRIRPVVQPGGSILLAGGVYDLGGRTPEILSAAGSTLLRPIPEEAFSVEVLAPAGGSVFALGSRLCRLQ